MFDLPLKLYSEMQSNGLILPVRSPEKIAGHINAKLRGKKIVLYAAGKHTVELFGFLNRDIDIVAIVDDEPTVDSICGVRVFKTDALSGIVYDVVVISSSFF